MAVAPSYFGWGDGNGNDNSWGNGRYQHTLFDGSFVLGGANSITGFI